jgi:hypothetical protein
MRELGMRAEALAKMESYGLQRSPEKAGFR